MVRSSSTSAETFLFRPFFCGKNPSKQNLSDGSPDAASAGTNAVAPGRHSTSARITSYNVCYTKLLRILYVGSNDGTIYAIK